MNYFMIKKSQQDLELSEINSNNKSSKNTFRNYLADNNKIMMGFLCETSPLALRERKDWMKGFACTNLPTCQAFEDGNMGVPSPPRVHAWSQRFSFRDPSSLAISLQPSTTRPRKSQKGFKSSHAQVPMYWAFLKQVFDVIHTPCAPVS